jgi:DDE superfamily endonuclease
MSLNAHLIAAAPPATGARIGGMDNSFIPKSGKKTHGLDWFYNGSASRSEKGLEISTIAVIDVAAHQAYTLSVQQTPANLAKDKAAKPSKRPSSRDTLISRTTIERAQAKLQQLPEVPPAPRPSAVEPTRMDHSIQHLQQTAPYFPDDLNYLVVDAGFSTKKFVGGVVALNLHLVGKLRHDANLNYLYSGAQKSRGAKRKYDGKVDFQDFSRLTLVRQLEPQLNLYTLVVWHVSLKRQIRIACLVDTRKPAKTSYALLFSTDVELDAERILEYYKARFQIEFIFRDAKQFTGLCDAQTRDVQRLDFHFNASLTALNLAKYEVQSRLPQTENPSQSIPFSMSSYKRLAFNDHLLSRFISMLDLDSTLIKSHPNYETLRSYGIIAP